MQMHDPPETSELLTFARTVEARSISRAARVLGVPRPTVSRRLARLEEKLGVRLLRRTTRAMAITHAGEALYAQARVVLAAVRDAEASVRRSDDAVRGLLRVSTPPMPGPSLGALVATFLARHPEVRVELDTSTRHVDLVAGGCDVAIRASSEIAPGLIGRTLMRSRMIAVASPSYLARMGAPKRAADLARHACLVGFARGEHPITHWPLLRGGKVRVEARLTTNDVAVQKAAAVAGHGIALLTVPMVYDELVSGALRPVLDARVGAEVRIAVVYAEREFVAPAVRAFVDAVVAWARDEPLFNRPMPACDGREKTPAAKRPAAKKRPRAVK
jgi:DNA-binding transcriptional LysR family regulator